MRSAMGLAATVLAVLGGCGGDDAPAGFEPASGGSAGALAGAGGGAGRDGGASGGTSGSAGDGGAAANGGGGAVAGRGGGGTSDAGAGTGGAAGEAGAAGAAGRAGGGGTGAVTCPGDPGPEPNDSEVLATPVCLAVPCEIDECDASGSTGFGGARQPAQGVIGPGDVDFWRFTGQDTLALCTVNAVASTQDSGFRLCAFAACPNGTTLRGCPRGAVDRSMIGFFGCCTQAPGAVELDHDCTASPNDDDGADVYVRIDDASACTSYTVEYHF